MADRSNDARRCGHFKSALDPHLLCRACRAADCDFVENPCEVCKTKTVEEWRDLYKGADKRAAKRKRRAASLSPGSDIIPKHSRVSQSPSASSIPPLLSPLAPSGLPSIFSPLITASDSSSSWPQESFVPKRSSGAVHKKMSQGHRTLPRLGAARETSEEWGVGQHTASEGEEASVARQTSKY